MCFYFFFLNINFTNKKTKTEMENFPRAEELVKIANGEYVEKNQKELFGMLKNEILYCIPRILELMIFEAENDKFHMRLELNVKPSNDNFHVSDDMKPKFYKIIVDIFDILLTPKGYRVEEYADGLIIFWDLNLTSIKDQKINESRGCYSFNISQKMINIARKAKFSVSKLKHLEKNNQFI